MADYLVVGGEGETGAWRANVKVSVTEGGVVVSCRIVGARESCPVASCCCEVVRGCGQIPA